jgi:hypothetical protein
VRRHVISIAHDKRAMQFRAPGPIHASVLDSASDLVGDPRAMLLGVVPQLAKLGLDELTTWRE